MAVVPADEIGGGVRAWQVLAGDPQRTVDRRAGRVDDRVIVRQQVLAGYVLAEADVAEEAKARMFGGLLVHAADRLDLRVVGRDAGANQAPRCGQALEHVDLDRADGVLQQVPGGVEAGGPGADYRDPDGGVFGHRVRRKCVRVPGGWRRAEWARPDSHRR